VAAVEAVLLDIDDTLLDTRAAFFAAIRSVARTWLGHLEDEQYDEVALRWIADVGGHFRTYTRGEITITEQRRRRVADLQTTFGGSELDEAAFAAWDAAYGAAFRASWRLHDDVLPFLDAVDAAGLPVGALSNSSRALSVEKLARLGLTERLPLLVSPDDLGFGKPDPQVFALAVERLGRPASSTAYVGDELDVDAQAATAAGLVGVWLDRRGPGDRPVADALRAADLHDVARLLDLGGPSARR
jgi:putative hydrolase of the HAD superfamily